ncbi:MAG: lasso peptide biosynthesis B2 protein [Ignavibacteria bacterium]
MPLLYNEIKYCTEKLILKKRNIPSTLYLGVKKDDNKMEAHAWLRIGDKIITGKNVSEDFTVISYFGG